MLTSNIVSYENNFNPGAIGHHRWQGAHKKAAHRRSLSLHFLLEYGFGIALWAGITLCAALLFVFGLFLASGWSVFLGICAGLLSYVMFTNKDYDEYSIKEAIEMLATGKEVSK